MAEILVELVAKIMADATELKKALSESEKDLQKTGKTLEKETRSWQEQFKAVGKIALGMGVAITGALTMSIMSFTKTGSELHDLALKTGVSAKALAGLKYAAEQNGASLGTVEMAIRRTASAMTDAKDGLAETKRAFDRMGLSLIELEGLNPEQQFMKIAGAIAEIPDPMTRAATAQDLFGRSGMDMLPMLSEGADGLRKMMEEGVKLTGWTAEGTKSADAFGDAIGTLKTAMTGIFNTIGTALAPMLKDFTDKVVDLIVKFKSWADAHPELTRQIGLLSFALGGFLLVAGTLITLAPAIGAAWAIAMGPVGWITLAIAGLIAAGILLWQNWDKVIDFLRSKFSFLIFSFMPLIAIPVLIAANFDRVKIAILSAIDMILAGLEKVVGWIPGFGDKIKSAREAISNMIEAEKIKRSLKDVEEALTDTEEIIDNTTESTNELNKALKANRVELEKQEKQLKQQITIYETLSGKVQDLRQQYEYERSEAGRLNITIKDVTFALYDQGWTVKDIIDKFMTLGDEGENVNAVLKAFGLTAQQVNDILSQQEAAIDKTTDAYKRQGDAVASARQQIEVLSDVQRRALPYTKETGISERQAEELAAKLRELYVYSTTEAPIIEYLSKTYPDFLAKAQAMVTAQQEAGETYFDLGAAFRIMLREINNSLWNLNFSLAGNVVSAQYGAIIDRPTLALMGEQAPAIKEAIIPETMWNEIGGGGITIQFTQPVFFDREDTMNVFVDKIRKGIQRQDRLRFGGAYGG